MGREQFGMSSARSAELSCNHVQTSFLFDMKLPTRLGQTTFKLNHWNEEKLGEDKIVCFLMAGVFN